MFEQMLKEMLIKLIKEDLDVQKAISERAFENVWDYIVDDVCTTISEAIDDITITVSR